MILGHAAGVRRAQISDNVGAYSYQPTSLSFALFSVALALYEV